MHCTLDELPDRISSAEYELRRYAFEQFGPRQQTLLLAQLLALMFNVNRASKTEPMTVEDLVPGIYGPPPDEQPAVPATIADAFAFIPDQELS